MAVDLKQPELSFPSDPNNPPTITTTSTQQFFDTLARLAHSKAKITMISTVPHSNASWTFHIIWK